MIFNFAAVNTPARYFKKEEVLSAVGEQSIFFMYYGHFPLRKKVKSIWNTKEKVPSAEFYFNRNGKLVYRDYGGEGDYLDCFAFVAKMHGIKYGEAIQKVAVDFGLTGAQPIFTQKQLNSVVRFDKQIKKELIIQFEPAPWTEQSLEFWKAGEITEAELTNDFIYTVNEIWFNKRKFWFKTNQIRYAILVHDWKGQREEPYVKIYSPFDVEDNKWRTNAPLDLPFGLQTLEFKSDTLIVTKSAKDMLVLKKIFPDVIAAQNESLASLPLELLQKLFKRFKTIYIWFDSDDTGVKNCIKFNELGCKYINTPKNLLPDIKDPFDFAKKYSVRDLRAFTETKIDFSMINYR